VSCFNVFDGECSSPTLSGAVEVEVVVDDIAAGNKEEEWEWGWVGARGKWCDVFVWDAWGALTALVAMDQGALVRVEASEVLLMTGRTSSLISLLREASGGMEGMYDDHEAGSSEPKRKCWITGNLPSTSSWKCFSKAVCTYKTNNIN
jgi:hypothetical protein